MSLSSLSSDSLFLSFYYCLFFIYTKYLFTKSASSFKLYTNVFKHPGIFYIGTPSETT